MNLNDYFDPVSIAPLPNGLDRKDTVAGKLQTGFDGNKKLPKNSLVIFGVNESRNSNNPGAASATDNIRKYLYSLSGSVIKHPLIELGNLKQTASPANTYIALADLARYFVEQGATCIVLGGTQELTWPLYQGIVEKSRPVNVTIVDQTIDLGHCSGDFSSNCFVEKFIQQPADQLYNLCLLGFQGYLTSSVSINTLQKAGAELIRLGAVRSAMEEVEPTIRDSTIVSIDMGCVRQGDSPGATNPSPNGFYAEELCQLARYAGKSHRMKAIGFFDYNTQNDLVGQTAHLAAQAAWYFIEGFNSSQRNLNISNPQYLKKFYVKSPLPNVEMVFFNNTLDETWWMEYPESENSTINPKVIACSYNDYLAASKGEIPERWIRHSKK